MIYIFGDSHANSNFRNMKYQHINFAKNSLTMNRVGRDQTDCIDFEKCGIKNGDTVIFQIGEIDCRCQVGKQIKLGRLMFEIITTLVNSFIDSIILNCKDNRDITIIISCVPPPMDQEYFESKNGPILHEYPFVGSNSDRVQYTFVLNSRLKQECDKNGFIFLDYYNHYADDTRMLKPLMSDDIAHIMENSYILRSLYQILDTINNPINPYLLDRQTASSFSAFAKVKIDTKQLPLAIVNKIEEPLSKPDNKIQLSFSTKDIKPRTSHFMSKLKM